VKTASDSTKKLLFALEDGLTVESVLIPDGRRLTLCVSSQVGCTFDCGFCLTGTMGLKRNLKAHEIVDQVLSVQDHIGTEGRLSNLVFMGMGEPLANFEAVSESISRLTNDTWGPGIPPRRITISTAGMASRIADVAPLAVNLAVSLNATTEAQRATLMPGINRSYSLASLMQACRTFPLRARSRLTFEYVLQAGLNDSPADATRLVVLLRGFRCKVNLIPFNEFPGNPLRRPSDAAVRTFQATLRRAGIDTFVRKSKGPDVLGACGQLGAQPTTAETDLDSLPTRLLACDKRSARTPA
jgi:23S rRNA (adenine2503-C2)-methyltransferase